MKRILLFLVSLCAFAFAAGAKVELPQLFSDGMIIQRNAPLIINGKADKKEVVRVSWRGQEVETVASGGVWSVTLEAGEAGGPFTIYANNAMVRDVYVGDVYLCAGQSNMEMKLRACMDACAGDVQGYSNDIVRYFKVPRKISFDALHFDVDSAKWEKLEDGKTLDWSALSYFIGRQMQEAENIPVGIIDVSYGGTPIEAWMDEWSLAQFDSVQARMKESQASGWLEGVYKSNEAIVSEWDANLASRTIEKKLKYTPCDVFSGKSDSNLTGETVFGKRYYRNTFKMNAAVVYESTLTLGIQPDSDSVFVNGVFVGASKGRDAKREYAVPSGVIKKGKNIIEIHALNYGPQAIGFQKGKDRIEWAGGNEFVLPENTWSSVLAAKMPARAALAKPYNYPCGCFNAMLCPILNRRFSGVVWYQGESNLHNPDEYGKLLTTMINSWREYLEQDGLPFYVVELAKYQHSDEEGKFPAWNKIQGFQKAVCDELNYCYFIKNGDIGEDYDVHPHCKKELADRIVKQIKLTRGIYRCEPSDIVILYDNDVHCEIDGYAYMAALKNEMKDSHEYVLTVSCGDFAQGGSIGAVSHGGNIIKVMNEVGYDIVTLGNHEFDYGIERQKELLDLLTAECLCCNFIDLKNNETPYKGYTVKEIAGRKIAFVGVSTPYTVSSSRPSFFKDMNTGRYLYDFSLPTIYETIQKNVDNARAEGAEMVIVLSHLGDVQEGDNGVTSIAMAESTRGIDLVLDGHSHSVIQRMELRNKDGEKVILTSTGTKFANIGRLLIHEDGNLQTELVSTASYGKKDTEVERIVKDIKDGYQKIARKPIGTSNAALKCYDDKGNRLVRNREAGIGNFCTDAFKTMLSADICIIGGGSIRDDIPMGTVTWNDIYSMFPFENGTCTCEIKGSTLLDALEYGVSIAPEEFGGFLHVSGIKFEYDPSIPSPVKYDSKHVFSGIDGKRRVRNVLVFDKKAKKYVALSPSKTYKMAGSTYYIEEHGDGFSMMSQCKNIVDGKFTDSELIEEYIEEYCKDGIDAKYGKTEGRIKTTK